MSIIKTENICKSFGSVDVLKNVSLTVEPGEVVVIIGPSGAGKSTYLRSLNHLEKPTSGKIWIDDKLIEDRVNGHNQVKLPHKERAAILLEMGMVFQRFNLFPHKTALQNVMLAPMNVKGVPEKEAKEKAVKLLNQVGLGDKLDSYPAKLSGGQQQRVAIARALVLRPAVLLLDEPFSALDAKIRGQMREELKRIQRESGITFIFVTHDQEEALSMSDTVVVMDKGEIQQIGSPIDIYNEPKNAFVADFIGESNILDGTMIEDYLVEVAGQRFKSLDRGFGKMAPVDVVIRPEDIDIVPTGSAAAHINGVVTSVTFKGVHYEIIVDVDGFKWMIQTTDSANVGDKIGLALTPDDIHVMAKSVYSGTMGDYSTFSDEMEEALQEEGSEHED